jgi:RNA polymerase sigma-70 factor (ECF subfamily)
MIYDGVSVISGDGFEPFFEEEFPRLVLYLMARGAQFSDAQDAAQEAMVKAHDNWEKIGKPRAWIRTVAARSGQLRRGRDVPWDDAAPEPAGADSGRADTGIDNLEVVRLLRLLSDAQRDVFALHLDGFDGDEISEIVGKSPATVRSHLRHARRRLQEVIESEATETSGSGPPHEAHRDRGSSRRRGGTAGRVPPPPARGGTDGAR